LNVLPIALPPLRTRRADIPLIVNYYVDTDNTEFRKRVRGVAPDAMERLQTYGWPGNVRELRNAVERAMLLVEGDLLTSEQFPLAGGLARLTERVDLPAGGIDLEQLERSLVIQALERSGWNQTKAAALLGLNRDQIRYHIEKFKLERCPSPERDRQHRRLILGRLRDRMAHVGCACRLAPIPRAALLWTPSRGA
jgi:DNA-binding NtrC family response regulator